METNAKEILRKNSIEEIQSGRYRFKEHIFYSGMLSVDLKHIAGKKDIKNYQLYSNEKKDFIILYIPIKKKPELFLILTKDISHINALISQILQNLLATSILVFVFILFFAAFLSRMVLVPIKSLGLTLARMNEKSLSKVDTDKMYDEFLPLGKSLNRLIDRVQTFIKYQTELFVGVAHEFKTPLAVMKTKNEVTLLKPRSEEEYKETIRQNIKSIDEMNQMMIAVLNIGRQEGAQLDPASVVDLVTFVKEKSNNFKILASYEKKKLKMDIQPQAYPTLTQPTLVFHVLQNFVQNAIKFSPENGTVTINTKGDDNGFYIEVLDEGCGIDESMDIFAPFKRYGEKGGVGLGLFLANGAAQALNAKISVKNRKDTQGTCASLFIPNQHPIR